MPASIAQIAYHVPDKILSNQELALQFPDWSVEKIEQKTGIVERHIAAPGECASDLAYAAARKLLDQGAVRPEEIDYVLLCTQAPDYFLPTTACLLQHRLGIPAAGAVDINQGCSGFVYALSLAKGLIETQQASRVLVLTADTYSRYIHPADKSIRTLFGDGASATLVVDGAGSIGPFVLGSDGSGAMHLCVRTGGARAAHSDAEAVMDAFGNVRSDNNLYMNGPEVFNFTLKVVPKTIQQLLQKSGKTLADIDLFVFHQANEYMLSTLRRKIGIPEDRFFVFLRNVGNTVSSTIPIALAEASKQGRLRPGQCIMLVGFGVGLSWGATLLTWDGSDQA